MARPVRTPMDEVGGEDEFHALLERGAELLTRGDADAARDTLERAAELRPGDPKTLGLLGQALYRLGRFDDSAALFGKLVEQNPLEAGAQVNLGLANLRARRHIEAISHLEKALDLNPDHRKAMGYLGLAWLEHGNVARAREWFSRAGSEHMVARCDELLGAARRGVPAPTDPQWTVAPAADVVAKAAEDVPAPARDESDDDADLASAMRFIGVEHGDAEPKVAPSAPAKAPQGASAWDEIPAPRSAAGWKMAPITVLNPPARCTDAGPIPLTVARLDAAPSEAEGGSSAPTAPVDAAPPGDAPAGEVQAEVNAAPSAGTVAAAAPAPARPVTLEQIASSGFAADDADRPTFSTDRGVLRVAVHGEVLARVRRLVAARGELEMAPETRRYRGRGTDKLFGDGRDAMHRVGGEGALLLRADESRFTVIDLAGSAGFFREDRVFAMDSSIEFDNARLTARAGPDVDLVQLRGEGAFVLTTRGDIVAVDVSGAPLRVAATALIGWTGALTPRLTTLAEGGSTGDTRAVELTGEGRVLLDSGAADG